MLQALNERGKVGIARGRTALQPVHDLHVRQGQQPRQRGCLTSLKCSAVRGPKATQLEIQLEQATPATPVDSVDLGITFTPSPALVPFRVCGRGLPPFGDEGRGPVRHGV